MARNKQPAPKPVPRTVAEVVVGKAVLAGMSRRLG